MTGLDKITQNIKNEVDSHISELLAKTHEEANAIQKEAEHIGAEQSAFIKQQAEKEAAAIRERAKSAAYLQKRRAILDAKQQIIAGIIKKAKESLYALPDKEYFELTLKMIRKYALPQNGDIIFSLADQKRLPENFEKTINSVLKEKGALLKISSKTRNIDGGFILTYSGIEENCSFEALFDAKYDILLDQVNKLLFLEADHD